MLMSRWGDAPEHRSFILSVTDQDKLQFGVYDAGFVSYQTGRVDYEDAEWIWLRVHFDADTGAGRSRVDFYSASDPPETSAGSISWGRPDYSTIKDQTVFPQSEPGSALRIGGHGSYAAAAMDVACCLIRQGRRLGGRVGLAKRRALRRHTAAASRRPRPQLHMDARRHRRRLDRSRHGRTRGSPCGRAGGSANTNQVGAYRTAKNTVGTTGTATSTEDGQGGGGPGGR